MVCFEISFSSQPIFLAACFEGIIKTFTKFLFLASKKFGFTLIAIIPPKNQPWHLLMMNYYQLLWPMSLIITSALNEPLAGLLILIHLILFPIITRNTLMDILAMLKAMVKKLVF